MYVRMYAYMHVLMYVCIDACMRVCTKRQSAGQQLSDSGVLQKNYFAQSQINSSSNAQLRDFMNSKFKDRCSRNEIVVNFWSSVNMAIRIC